uniref:beta-1,6-N-acetylglucosaminyltransferase n=1 Tax=Pedobacter schmidteae TaxID=2201271 RepID=UPI000EB54EAB|nr:beta-1,6-N-acetylglucosaminyltransferase [Pedobacter schmidteae]
MRIAHVIMAHKNPGQLLRLIRRLQHPNFDFYIHLDGKVPMEHFELLQNMDQVSFIQNRVNCNWGGNSLFLGIISSLKEVISLHTEYGYINLLSAQDYPLKSPEEIYQFFVKNYGKNFISFDPLKSSEWWKGAIKRYEKYHFTDFKFKGKHVLEKVLNKIAPLRKLPNLGELYGGSKSTWWSLTHECATYVVNIFDKDTELKKFLRFSWGTDEFVLTTLVMNSPYRESTENNNQRYIDWSEGNPNPKLLKISDYDEIINSGMLFARKFDIDIDEKILDKIDLTP